MANNDTNAKVAITIFLWSNEATKKVMTLKKQAIDTNSKQILGFVCGKTDTNTFKRLYQQLNTHSIQLFFSDYWKSYRQVILKPKHITSKAQTFTIEGYNSLIRHFIARFTRKSKCYSKSEKMIENTLNLLFAKWNGSLRYVF